MGHPDQMAECPLPMRSMRCFCRCFFGRPCHQSSGQPLDDHLGPDSDEATVFVSFFANSLALLVVGQALEGVPWGFFIANSPAYASEIVPLSLRGACTATLQMSWSIGSIIVAAATLGHNKRQDQWTWRVPLALQWIFPVSLSFDILYARELTRLDTSPDPRLPRPRITLVADSSRTQRGGSSLHQAP